VLVSTLVVTARRGRAEKVGGGVDVSVGAI